MPKLPPRDGEVEGRTLERETAAGREELETRGVAMVEDEAEVGAEAEVMEDCGEEEALPVAEALPPPEELPPEELPPLGKQSVPGTVA